MAFSDYRRDRDRDRDDRNDWNEDRSGVERRFYGERGYGRPGDDFGRRGWREGSDYYGNRGERYEPGRSRGYATWDYNQDQSGQDRSAWDRSSDENWRRTGEWRGNEQRYSDWNRDDWRGREDQGRDFGRDDPDRSWQQRSWRSPWEQPDAAWARRDEDERSQSGRSDSRDWDRDDYRRESAGPDEERWRSYRERYGAWGGLASAVGLDSIDTGGPDTRYRGRGPRDYRRSDERIREDACECLTDDPRIDATHIEVTAQNGEITLSGMVNSREEKRRAEDLVERLSGVTDVHNRLRVQRDESLLDKAKAALTGSDTREARSDSPRESTRSSTSSTRQR
jgi:hypothetical protein